MASMLLPRANAASSPPPAGRRSKMAAALVLGLALVVCSVTADERELKPSTDSTTSSYVTPKISASQGVHLLEAFDQPESFWARWVASKDPKYEGKWKLESGPDRPDADLQLVLPEKARHYAVSTKLDEPFRFSQDKPLALQYEVQFREALDCGGAYVKLVRESAARDLAQLSDKTPFTIMFGPDKCGGEAKLHLIVQYLNPKTQEYSEKHWTGAKLIPDLMPVFSDGQHHLFTLNLNPDNTFEVFVDLKSVGKGSLLEDMNPPINPPAEIVDPNDSKPDDWDERSTIDDPDAKKPDDWDEEAPKQIQDPDATKPDGWLEDEPALIPDPASKKPDDWEEMDGEWAAPLIDNPACASAVGCGKWEPPMITNPNYKGKWRPNKISNPAYQGKWKPRNIPNPDYYFDDNPFKSLDPIGGVAFELWSMADNVAFDNLIIANYKDVPRMLQLTTWRLKKAKADASSPSIVTRVQHYFSVYPWLWVVVALAVALPLFFVISYCCDTKRRTTDAGARRKKLDESRPDDDEETKDDEEEPLVDKADKARQEDEEDEEEDDDDEEDEDGAGEREQEDEEEQGEDEEEKEDNVVSGDKTPKRSARQRKTKT